MQTKCRVQYGINEEPDGTFRPMILILMTSEDSEEKETYFMSNELFSKREDAQSFILGIYDILSTLKPQNVYFNTLDDKDQKQ